jgi:putative transposase
VVRVYAQHYNEHRPHRSLDQRPPLAKPPSIDEPATSDALLRLDLLRRREQLGGLLHEYKLVA